MEQFIELINQPIPIIGFTIGAVLFFVLSIIAKTSIGKKALRKIQDINDKLNKKCAGLCQKLDEAEQKCVSLTVKYNEVIKNKDEEIKQLTDEYEIKLDAYKNIAKKQDEIIRVICENSVNVKIKEAFENYDITFEDLPVNEIIENAKNEVKNEYNDRLNKLEEHVYGKDNQETSEQI